MSRDLDHSEIVKRERRGELLIGVDPAAARQLFTSLSGSECMSSLGDTLLTERLIVLATWIGSFLAMLVSLGLAVWVFGWWSALVVPVTVAVWGTHLGRASMGKQAAWRETTFFVLALVALLLPDTYTPFQLWLAVLAGSFFLTRLTYVSSVGLLRRFALKSPEALVALLNKVIVVKEVDDAASF